MENLYSILELTSQASTHDIKTAFRRLAKAYHPDKNPGDPAAAEMFRKVRHAYDTLVDDAKRARYDELLRRTISRQAGTKTRMWGAGSTGAAGKDTSATKTQRSAGGATDRGTTATQEQRSSSGKTGTTEQREEKTAYRPRSDSENAGIRWTDAAYKRTSAAEAKDPAAKGKEDTAGTRTRAQKPRPTQTIVRTGKDALEILSRSRMVWQQGKRLLKKIGVEAQAQATSDIRLSLREAVFGTTCMLDAPWFSCSECGSAWEPSSHIAQCPQCSAGKDALKPTKIELRVAGPIADGSVLVLPAPGSPLGLGRALHVVVHVEKHPVFSIDNEGISFTLPVDFATAALGGELDIPLFNQTIRLRISAGAQSNDVIKITYTGARSSWVAAPLELAIRLFIETPRKLKAEQAALLRAFQSATTPENSPLHKRFLEQAGD